MSEQCLGDDVDGATKLITSSNEFLDIVREDEISRSVRSHNESVAASMTIFCKFNS